MRTLEIVVLLAIAPGWAASAAGAPLVYGVDSSRRNLEVRTNANGSASADLVGFDLVSKQFIDVARVGATPNGALVVDTGLPGSFQEDLRIEAGSQLEFSADGFELLLSDLFVGTPVEDELPSNIALLPDIADATLTFDGPLDAPLVPTGQNQYTWAGTADVTLDFTFNATVNVPTVGDFGLPSPVPVSVPLPSAPLAGEFQGDSTGTEVVMGVDELSFQEDVSGEVPTIVADLGSLPLVDGDLSVDVTQLAPELNGNVVATNTTPIPEPGTVALLGAGLFGVGAAARCLRG